MIAISRRKLILLALITVAAIVVVVLALRPARGEGSDTQGQGKPTGTASATMDTQEWVRLSEKALANAPEEKMMSNGLLAIRGRATFTGFSSHTAFITVNLDSGKKYDLTVEVGKAGVFRSEDVFSHPNQPAPTAENPLAVLMSLKDTPVFLRCDPTSLQVWSIIILGDGGSQ